MNFDKKEQYRQLCRKEQLPVFMQDWWLDIICGTAKWDVALSKDKQSNIQAAMVFCVTKKWGFKMILRQGLTPFSGIWIKYPDAMHKTAKQYSFEHRITEELIQQIPVVSFLNLDFHYSYKNALAFHWAGFKILTRYTYVLGDCSNPEILFANLKSEIRNRIKKAKQLVRVESSNDLKSFYTINKVTFTKQDIIIPYNYELLEKIDQALGQREMRKIYFAKDQNNNIHAAIYIIFDFDAAYYFMGGSHPDFGQTRAMFLLFWEAILEAGKRGLKFDFEGTMLPKVEPVFRAFGAIQQSYVRVEKSSRIFEVLRNLMGR